MGYGRNISDKAWVILEPFLEPQQKGRPRQHSLRKIIDAIRYVQRTGCQMPIETSAKGFSAMAGGLYDFLALAEQRFMGTDHARAATAGACESGAQLVLIRLFLVLPHLLKILVDGGYKQGVIDWAKAMFGYALEVVKHPELHLFKVLSKRWIVERIFGWCNEYRRLSKDYEHNPKTSEAMIHLLPCNWRLRRLPAL